MVDYKLPEKHRGIIQFRVSTLIFNIGIFLDESCMNMKIKSTGPIIHTQFQKIHVCQ